MDKIPRWIAKCRGCNGTRVEGGKRRMLELLEEYLTTTAKVSLVAREDALCVLCRILNTLMSADSLYPLTLKFRRYQARPRGNSG